MVDESTEQQAPDQVGQTPMEAMQARIDTLEKMLMDTTSEMMSMKLQQGDMDAKQQRSDTAQNLTHGRGIADIRWNRGTRATTVPENQGDWGLSIGYAGTSTTPTIFCNGGSVYARRSSGTSNPSTGLSQVNGRAITTIPTTGSGSIHVWANIGLNGSNEPTVDLSTGGFEAINDSASQGSTDTNRVHLGEVFYNNGSVTRVISDRNGRALEYL